MSGEIDAKTIVWHNFPIQMLNAVTQCRAPPELARVSPSPRQPLAIAKKAASRAVVGQGRGPHDARRPLRHRAP
ncbi:hypothetical protein, partial [Mesorhizobium sp. B2-6-5]|uniref:hypothetical protein n=1 Tax=Mesorhizobium sp. B2-6-5 TaxID=2589912 RepID=UPI001AEE1054